MITKRLIVKQYQYIIQLKENILKIHNHTLFNIYPKNNYLVTINVYLPMPITVYFTYFSL